ncbi:MAG: DUF554 domain-containing protein [Defluviitaleaceae bacterium]|nr:DUF554 domain-containing protein [Defluviitaleaceae bacterium]MCL2262677.1 DUF554 domain-containing protein [Defluviitaleaceae bacterium]
MITGAIINAIAILVGGGIGFLLKNRVSPQLAQGVMRALGLCVCVIGIQGALGGDIMLMAISIALGALTGELLHMDSRLNRFGLFLQNKFGKSGTESTFAQGFVSATLLFCVGAMAIVGSIDSGLRGDHSIVMTKSILDAFAAAVLASTFGAGVLFSAAAVLLYQGSIEFFAAFLQDVFTYTLITQISAVGGVMILAIGINMIFGEKIKTANLLPGFVFAVGYYFVFI